MGGDYRKRRKRGQYIQINRNLGVLRITSSNTSRLLLVMYSNATQATKTFWNTIYYSTKSSPYYNVNALTLAWLVNMVLILRLLAPLLALNCIHQYVLPRVNAFSHFHLILDSGSNSPWSTSSFHLSSILNLIFNKMKIVRSYFVLVVFFQNFPWK